MPCEQNNWNKEITMNDNHKKEIIGPVQKWYSFHGMLKHSFQHDATSPI